MSQDPISTPRFPRGSPFYCHNGNNEEVIMLTESENALAEAVLILSLIHI